MLTREQVRREYVEWGNKWLAERRCSNHGERAYLANAASPINIVISGCCRPYIEGEALQMGFRVDREVKGGKPTLLLSVGLQVLPS